MSEHKLLIKVSSINSLKNNNWKKFVIYILQWTLKKTFFRPLVGIQVSIPNTYTYGESRYKIHTSTLTTEIFFNIIAMSNITLFSLNNQTAPNFQNNPFININNKKTIYRFYNRDFRNCLESVNGACGNILKIIN